MIQILLLPQSRCQYGQPVYTLLRVLLPTVSLGYPLEATSKEGSHILGLIGMIHSAHAICIQCDSVPNTTFPSERWNLGIYQDESAYVTHF